MNDAHNTEVIHLSADESSFLIEYYEHLKNLQRFEVSKNNRVLYDVDGVLFRICQRWDARTNSYVDGNKVLLCYPQGRKEKEYAIPEGTTEIGEKAFYNCKKLRMITIPDSVLEIRNDAFLKCNSLTMITAKGVEKLGNIWGNQKKCEVVKPIIAPKLTHTKVANKELKMCLAMGYLLASDLYNKRAAASYKKYIDENDAFLLAAAKRHNIEEIVRILDDKTQISAFAALQYMSVEDAKVLFELGRKTSGIKIYAYNGNDTVVDIPQTIGKTDVTLVRNGAFDPKVVIRCSAKLFPKLPQENQIATLMAYKHGEVPFSGEQCLVMDQYIDKKSLNLALYAIEKENVEFLQFVLTNAAPFKDTEFLELRSHMKSNAEINAILLEYQNKNYAPGMIDDLQFARDNKVLGELENIYSIDEIPGGCEISKYNGKETEILIPDIIDGKPVISIASQAFSRCRKLERVIIPVGVKSIGDRAFYECKNLKEAVVNAEISEIPTQMFCGCISLRSVTLPQTVKTIGNGAFTACMSLMSMELSGVSCIDADAFSECLYLMNVVFDDSLQEIKGGAFTNYIQLTIHAPAGSCAEIYAKENNIPFVAEG